MKLPDLTPQEAQPVSQKPESTGSVIKKNIKTKEIDGHLWAEVAYDGKTGWVAADYLKTEKPQNSSVPTSDTPQKTAQSVSIDSVNNGSKIDINDHSALQSAFNSVRKPGAAEGDLGEPGDFDGVWGLQCVDLSNWFLTNYTTLGRVGGDGKVDHETFFEFEDGTLLYYHDGYYYTPALVGDRGDGIFYGPHIEGLTPLENNLFKLDYHLSDEIDRCDSHNTAIIGLKEKDDGSRFWSIYSLDYNYTGNKFNY